MSNTNVQLMLSQEIISTMLRLETLRSMNSLASMAKPAAKAGSFDEALLSFSRTQKNVELKNVVKTMAANVAADKSMPQIKLLLPKINTSLTPAADIVKVTKLPQLPASGLNLLTAPGTPPVWMGGKIFCHLHEVTCLDETDGFLGSEAGEDEIYLEGLGINPEANVVKWQRRKPNGTYEDMDSFKVGNFEESSASKKTVKYVPAMRLLEFPMSDKFPLTFTNTFILLEADDEGSVAKEARKLIEKAKTHIKKFVDDIMKSIPVIPQEWLKKAGEWIQKAINDLLKWFYDLFFGNDRFKPVVTQFTIPSAAVLDKVVAEISSASDKFNKKQITSQQLIQLISQATSSLIKAESVDISGHGGKYRLKWQWSVYPGTGLG